MENRHHVSNIYGPMPTGCTGNHEDLIAEEMKKMRTAQEIRAEIARRTHLIRTRRALAAATTIHFATFLFLFLCLIAPFRHLGF
jgi:hypothetical protein